MKILMTGASGFLGRHLHKRLTSEGHEVVGPGTKQCDLTNRGSLEDTVGEQKFDQIFHLASWSRAGSFCAEHPGQQIIVNQRIDVNVLDYWKTFQPSAKLIAMGSSVAYDPELPLKEENYLKGEPIATYIGYGHAKKMLFANLKSLNKEFGLEYMCFVPSTMYGPDYHTDGRPMHFIYDLMRKIISAKEFGSEVVLWGDGTQEREIIHIEDVMNIILNVTERHKNELVNLGSGKGYMIKEFAQMICDRIGYDFGKIKFDTTKPTGAKSKYFDLTKLRKLYPEFKEKNMREGINETIDWMLANPQVYTKKD